MHIRIFRQHSARAVIAAGLLLISNSALAAGSHSGGHGHGAALTKDDRHGHAVMGERGMRTVGSRRESTIRMLKRTPLAKQVIRRRPLLRSKLI